MVAKDEILFVKNIDGFDGPLASEDVATNNQDMENVHQEFGSLLKNNVSQLMIMQVKIALWKPHNQASNFLGFFVVNYDLLVDLENSQMCNLCYLQIKENGR